MKTKVTLTPAYETHTISFQRHNSYEKKPSDANFMYIRTTHGIDQLPSVSEKDTHKRHLAHNLSQL